MLYEIKEVVFNRLIVWLMNHCHCWASVFYTACNRYYKEEVVGMYESWKETKFGKNA